MSELSSSNLHKNKKEQSQKSATSLIRQYKTIIYGGLVLIITLTVANALYLGKQLEAQLLNEEQHKAVQTLLALNKTISVALTHVEKMRYAIEHARTSPTLLSNEPKLNYLNQQAPSSMAGAPWDKLPDKLKQQYGQLFIKSQAPNITEDILAVLRYLPESVITHRIYPYFQWSYYYHSEQMLTHVYPFLGAEDLLGATGSDNLDQAIEVIYEAGGTFPLELVNVSNNPKRGRVWTTPYLDAGGKGMMVSLLEPCYINDEFVGAVGTDITLKVLDGILSNLEGTISI